MNNFSVYESIVDKYNEKLSKFDDKILELYFCRCLIESNNSQNVTQDDKKSIFFYAKKILSSISRGYAIGTNKTILKAIIEKTDEIAKLHRDFELELKESAKLNGLTANHVFGGSEEAIKIPNGALHTSPNIPTQYERKRGDFLFATSLDERKQVYCIRSKAGGMHRLDETTYYMPHNNLDKGNKLKEPRLVFNLPIDDFYPETRFDKSHKFEFDDEWFCDHDIRVCDGRGEYSVSVERVSDVSLALKHFKVISNKDDLANYKKDMTR